MSVSNLNEVKKRVKINNHFSEKVKKQTHSMLEYDSPVLSIVLFQKAVTMKTVRVHLSSIFDEIQPDTSFLICYTKSGMYPKPTIKKRKNGANGTVWSGMKDISWVSIHVFYAHFNFAIKKRNVLNWTKS